MPRIMIFGGGPRKTFNGVSGLGTSASAFNFLTSPFGDAAPDRMLGVGICMGTSGTNFTISSVTVAGSPATVVGTDGSASDTFSKTRVALYRVALPLGADGTINVTFGGSVSQCQIATWSVYGLNSQVPAFTANNGAIENNPVSTTIDAPATGILLCAASIFSSSGLMTLNGVVNDAVQGLNSDRQWGSYQSAGAEIARALSFTGAAGADSSRALVAGAWA